jgi:hypothetical protein
MNALASVARGLRSMRSDGANVKISPNARLKLRMYAA